MKISNIQKDAIIHAVNRARIPNLYFAEIMTVRAICLGGRDWLEVASSGVIDAPNTITEIKLSPGEQKAIIALATQSRENSLLEGAYAIPLEMLKIELEKGLESQKP